jgi:hypothetical protein
VFGFGSLVLGLLPKRQLVFVAVSRCCFRRRKAPRRRTTTTFGVEEALNLIKN